MPLTGRFKIDVRGRPRSRMWAEVMRSTFHGTLKGEDRFVKGSETWFSDIAVVYTWEGRIEAFTQVRYILKLLTRGVRNYFTSWKFTLEVKLTDQGV